MKLLSGVNGPVAQSSVAKEPRLGQGKADMEISKFGITLIELFSVALKKNLFVRSLKWLNFQSAL